GLRCSDRCVDHADALSVEGRVEGARELAVVVTDQELQGPVAVAEREHEIPRLLRCPRTIRVLGQASKVHPPGGELDEEQHIDSPQADGVDREEVARDRAASLTADELAPGKPVARRGRSKARGGEDPTDARGRDGEPPVKLTGDPLISPPPVLPGEPQHKLADFLADLGAPGTP